MANDDLRKLADELEARLEAGRPGRREARERTVGRLATSGGLKFRKSELDNVRRMFREEPDVQVLDWEVLLEHGYTDRDGIVTGPGSWPGGGAAGAVRGRGRNVGGAPEAPAAGSGSSGGSGSISRAEARRQVAVSRTHADWWDVIRGREVWTRAQERRTWMLGLFFAPGVLKSEELRAVVRRNVEAAGDAPEIELWSEDDLRADYTPIELGEGA